MRPAGAADAPEIAAVDAVSDPHPWTADEFATSLALPTTLAWVVDGVGHVVVSAVAGEGEVLRLAVHPDRRRQGWARRLMSAATQGWRGAGVDRAFLEVRADNVAARALYDGLGWQVTGTRRRYYDDGADAVTMQLTIRA